MPNLRDGMIKRGASWSYVIRVPDPATGVNKPTWVSGFATEADAKAARDEARVRARRNEYVNRSVSTVADYLAEWAEAHASTVKPKTLAGYRHDIDHYIVPRIGRMRLQALRPAVISKLYRDLAEHGGRNGQPLSVSTVSHIHRTLRKALADAVDVEQVLAVNPAARSKRPRISSVEPVQIWTVDFQHRLVAAATAVHQADQVPAELHPVELVVAVTRHHRLQPCRDRGLGKPRRPALDRDHLRAVPGAQPGQEPARVFQRHRIPGQAERLQVLPPQGQRTGIRLHRVRRDPLDPQVLQELLSRADRPVITAQHRPGPLPARQHEPLRPALPVTPRHARSVTATDNPSANDTPGGETLPYPLSRTPGSSPG
jgi:hypothetical protein